ncbi:MAG: hypothetical protein Q8O95_01650 [bacterium]|nr:hypothetical protein [bacterium]
MFHKGARTTGGQMDAENQKKVLEILDQFALEVQKESNQRKLQRAVVRSQLACNLVIFIDKKNIFVLATKSAGMPTTIYFDLPEKEFSIQQALNQAKWEFGFDEPFVISFPKEIIEKSEQERAGVIAAVAKSHVESEFNRVVETMSLIQVSPVFGPASYKIDPKLVFVLMPFEKKLTKNYKSIIKPTVESKDLICRRADDFKTNKVVLNDIWKALCEARIVIADLTSLNPNVMYELGIAHTLGKETIMIYQKKTPEPKFPFDISHIRRIEYKNSIKGKQVLESDLDSTIEGILNPVSISEIH